MLRSAILAAARNRPHRDGSSRTRPSRATSCAASSAARTPPPGSTAAAALIADGLTVTLDHLGEDTTDRAQADATTAAYTELLDALAAAGPDRAARPADRPGRGQRQAQRGRAGARRRRREDRARARPHDLRARPRRRRHGHPRHGGPHHHRLDAGGAARSCARTSPRPARCCRPTCAAPRATAATSPTPAAGCGCARAPTTSPRRSPSGTVSTSTAPTSGASTCCSPATATRCSPPTTRRLVDDRHRPRRGARPRPELRVPDAVRHPPRRAAAPGRGRAHRAGLRPLRGAVVRLPDASAGRAARPTSRSSPAHSSRRAETCVTDHRDPRRRQDRRGAALGAAARRPHGRRHRRRREVPGAGRRTCARPTASRTLDAVDAVAAASTVLLAIKPQDIDTLLAEIAPSSAPGTWSCRSPRASPPRTSSGACPTACPSCAACPTPRRSSTRR